MPSYQLRMKKDQRLEDFFQSMIRDAWDVAARYLDVAKIEQDDFRNFEAETRIGLQPFISAYDLCGSFTECADEVEGSPWLDYDDHIYHLVLPSTLPQFLEQLSYFSFQPIQHLAKAGLEQLVYEMIQNVFRRHLAQHIYYNPFCHRMTICKDSRPVYPWML
ncbi:hypothetical protein L0222_30160 [bacterium]|nr:hypothetical protein [bacterium]